MALKVGAAVVVANTQFNKRDSAVAKRP
jgi:hypothetical protein